MPSRDGKGAFVSCHDRIANVRFLTGAARFIEDPLMHLLRHVLSAFVVNHSG